MSGKEVTQRVAPVLLPAGERESFADLDALDRLRPHQRRGEPRIETIVLACIRPEAWRNPARAHLDDAPDRVAIGTRLVDPPLEILGHGLPLDLDADVLKK